MTTPHKLQRERDQRARWLRKARARHGRNWQDVCVQVLRSIYDVPCISMGTHARHVEWLRDLQAKMHEQKQRLGVSRLGSYQSI